MNAIYLALGIKVIIYGLSALWTINEASKAMDASPSLDFGEHNWKINPN